MMTKSSNWILEPGSKMNKFIFATAFFFALLAAMNINPSSAKADRIYVAVLDLGYVLKSSKAMKSADQQIQALEAQFLADRKEKENALREEEQKLQQQRVLLSPDAFSKKREEFSARVQNHRQAIQNKGRQFALTRSATVANIEKALEPIVSAVAKRVGANLIVERKQTIFNAKTLDISEQVAAELNKKLPTIKVTLVELPKK
ncbi:MAG: OmpH family outer membrane protein [Sneathiellales bacterium]|nr:OmpH family outer membrane protein [Sneathiellales bacterium]